MATNTKELGRTGLADWSGHIQEDFLRELRGKEAYKRYDEMRRNSPIIGALIQAVEQSIRVVSWEYTSDDGPEDQRLEFLNASLDNMTSSWNDHIIEALTFLPFGYSIFEIVYERVGNQIMWRKFAVRGQDTVERWDFDEAGGLAGFQQRTVNPVHTADIPIEKLVLYRTRVEKNNPEGWSILRSSWIPYYYAKNIQMIEAIGVERDLNGLPVIKLPKMANTDITDTKSDASIAAKMVRNIRNDEQAGIVLPFDWELTLLSTDGSRLFDTNAIINRHESRMLMTALAQFLMLGQEGVGSLALSKDQTDFFTMSVNAIADIFAVTHTKFAIPRLMKLNGFDWRGIKMGHTPAGDIDVEALSALLQKVGNKITWTVDDEVWLRQVANLPEVDAETILEEKEKNALSLATMFQPRGGGPPKDEDEDEDQMEAFESEELPPDDPQRVRFERRWDREFRKFFNAQKNRILKGTRKTYKDR